MLSLLTLLSLLGPIFGLDATTTAQRQFARDFDDRHIVGFMSYPGVSVKLEWRVCGQVNAFYQAGTVTMCYELANEHPGMVRFFLAHEMAHAVIEQLGLNTVGSEEDAADELATVTMAVNGYDSDLWAAKAHFDAAGPDYSPADTHSPAVKRAYRIGCMLRGKAGSATKFDGCENTWRHAVVVWNRLLGVE